MVLPLAFPPGIAVLLSPACYRDQTSSRKQYFKVLPSLTISGPINNTCKKELLNRYDFYLDGVPLDHFYPHKVCKKRIFLAPFILPDAHNPCLSPALSCMGLVPPSTPPL